MNTAALSALSAWVGGVISWVVAAAFDYQARENALATRIKELLVEIKYDKPKEKDYGLDPNDSADVRAEKLKEAAANQIGGKPGFGDSLKETYTQPLFVGTLTGGVGLFFTPQNRQMGVPLLLWVAVTAATIVITVLSGKNYRVAGTLRHWCFVIGAWGLVLAVFVGAAWAASQGEDPRPQPHPSHSPAGDRPDGG